VLFGYLSISHDLHLLVLEGIPAIHGGEEGSRKPVFKRILEIQAIVEVDAHTCELLRDMCIV